MKTKCQGCVYNDFGTCNFDDVCYKEPCCQNCKHLDWPMDVCRNSFPYCKKHEVGLNKDLMDIQPEWCEEFENRN